MKDSLFIRRQNRAYLFLVDIYWALKLGGGQLIYKKAKQITCTSLEFHHINMVAQ